MKDIKRSNDTCHVPVLCIWKGQIPTKTLQDVILHNFLPNTILGFVATEKCDEIEPVDPEALTGSHLCPGCEVMEEKCPGLCEDPPEVESVKSMLSIEDEPESCLNCTFKNLGIEDEPCDGCFDRNEWKGMPVMDEGPTPCADEAESLYRAGCWTTLENRMHDLMSEWSLIADKCKCRIEVEDCDEIKCTFCDHSFNDCYFEMCPRIHGA